MAFDHDMTDPEVDAEARELTFSMSQACYVGHHIRNALQTIDSTPDLSRARLLNLAKAIEKRVREDGGK